MKVKELNEILIKTDDVDINTLIKFLAKQENKAIEDTSTNIVQKANLKFTTPNILYKKLCKNEQLLKQCNITFQKRRSNGKNLIKIELNRENELNLKLGGIGNSQKIYDTYNLLHYIDELSVGKMYGIQRVTKDITILTKEEVVLKQKYEELKDILIETEIDLEEKDKEISNLKTELDIAWEDWNNLEQGSYEEEFRLKEKIKELEDENYIQKKIIFEDCIPKQELIDKIDELEQDIKEFEQIDNTGRFKRENCISFYKKEILEELLKNK